VRVRIDPKSEKLQLRAGMSATVEIDTGHRRTLSELF
jgi:multidrug resistance efflux pump